MASWEYLVRDFERLRSSNETLEQWLNKWGAMGYELIAMDPADPPRRLVFKKPLAH